jgi:hypothetical protein
VELWNLLVNDQPIYSYFLEIKEQIGQDSAFDGHNSLKGPKPAYVIIKQNSKRNTYSLIFSVQGLHGSNFDSKRYRIMAVETMMHSRYAIVSENRRDE